jgi:hypothetical protein
MAPTSNRLTAEELRQVVRLADDLGDARAAAELRIHQKTMLRIMARRDGTIPSVIQCVRTRLCELTASKASSSAE